uniref:Uncharacterized protein n=1 Tax=Peronospora matthiolae TaxID=2874970 RepID=A0AAV1V178_9STRA
MGLYTWGRSELFKFGQPICCNSQLALIDHHSMDQNLEVRLRSMCQRRAIAIRSLGKIACRWKLTNSEEWWREVECFDSDLLTGVTAPALEDPLSSILSLLSILCPSRFPKQPDCGLVLPDTCARVYEHDNEIRKVADTVIQSGSLVDVLGICEIGRGTAVRRS